MTGLGESARPITRALHIGQLGDDVGDLERSIELHGSGHDLEARATFLWQRSDARGVDGARSATE